MTFYYQKCKYLLLNMQASPEATGIEHHVVNQESCRFKDPTLRGLIPYVYFDPSSSYELPCNGLAILGGKYMVVSPEYAAKPVPLRGCLEQRRLGLCPRGLGLDIPPELKL